MKTTAEYWRTEMKPALTILTALLAPHALCAAWPAQAGAPSHGDKGTAGRIAIRDGRFVDTGTGRLFRPFGVNHYRLDLIAEKKQGHSAFSPGSYDETFITRMMEKRSRAGFNTVRSFLSNHSGAGGIVTHPQSAEVNPCPSR